MEYSPAEMEALVEKARTAPSKKKAVKIVDRIINNNPAPVTAPILPSVIRAWMLKFNLTDGAPPEPKEELARQMLEFADTHEGREARRQAANLRLALANNFFTMSKPGADDEMRQEIVELFGDDRDPMLRLAVARAKREYAFRRPDPEEKTRLIAEIVRDYIDSDEPEIGGIVIQCATQVYTEIPDPKTREAYCLDIVNRYGYLPEGLRPPGFGFFVKEKRRHFGPVRDRLRDIEADLEKHARRSTAESFVTIRSLLEDKALVLGYSSGERIALFREFAERSSQAVAAQLLYHAATLEKFSQDVLLEIVDRFSGSDDLVAVSVAARALSMAATAGKANERVKKLVSDFAAVRLRSLTPSMSGTLLLLKAGFVPDDETRLLLYSRVLGLPEESEKDGPLRAAAPALYENPRLIAAGRKYGLTGDVEVMLGYLDDVLERTGRADVALYDCSELMKEVADGEDLQEFGKYAAMLRRRNGVGAACSLRSLVSEARASRDGARARELYLEALEYCETRYRDDMLLLSDEFVDGLLGCAADDAERLAFVGRLLGLNVGSAGQSALEGRLLAERERLSKCLKK